MGSYFYESQDEITNASGTDLTAESRAVSERGFGGIDYLLADTLKKDSHSSLICQIVYKSTLKEYNYDSIKHHNPNHIESCHERRPLPSPFLFGISCSTQLYKLNHLNPLG